MGIKGLTKLLAENAPNCIKLQKFETYSNRTIAIDASKSIYRFLGGVRINGTEMLTNEAGEVTSHLQGMFLHTIRLLEAGIKPVFVFDGESPDLKKQQQTKHSSKQAGVMGDLSAAIENLLPWLVQRGDKEAIREVNNLKVTQQHNEGCMKLLGLMGVPVVAAPSEAEAQCAALCKSGKVFAVASEDMDTLTYGASLFLRRLLDQRSKKNRVMEFEMAKVLKELSLTMDQFIDLCILSGCDYCDKIKGIGGLTALKLIRQHGSIETILENLNQQRYKVADDWPYQDVRRLFKEPFVFPENEEPELKWSPPNEEGLVNFLVKENSFNIVRVTKAIERLKAANIKSSQGRLESFIKPDAIDFAPIKRKETKDASLKGTATKEQKANGRTKNRHVDLGA